MSEDKGLRFNTGKVRYDLVPAFAQEQYARVLTKGSEKYADRNWELGMKWSKVLASMKRHIAEIEKGEDYDSETGLLHAAHVMCNAAFLTEYYKIYPQGDDRPHSYLKEAKIGLDIDGVLGDFITHLLRTQDIMHFDPSHWNDPIIREEFDKVKDNPAFWISMPVLTHPEDIHFEPHCYITARSIDPAITQEWLDRNGFPKAKLYCVGVGESKVDVAKESGIDIFVDDSFQNFQELTKAGIFTYLMSAPYNTKYNVGHKRIRSLNELKY